MTLFVVIYIVFSLLIGVASTAAFLYSSDVDEYTDGETWLQAALVGLVCAFLAPLTLLTAILVGGGWLLQKYIKKQKKARR
jgi:hypothetical protein